MKNFKRTIAFVLALMLLVSGAAMAEGYGFNASGLPIVSEPITLKILTQDPSSTTTFSKAGDAPVWKYLSEKLGVNFEFESYTPDDLSTKLSLIMADPDTYPDIFWLVFLAYHSLNRSCTGTISLNPFAVSMLSMMAI